MKKLITSSLIVIAIVSSTSIMAAGNTGIIKFTGAISSSTCNFNIVANGSTSPTGVVDLGVWSVSDATSQGAFGNKINVSLVPDEETCDTSPAGSDASVQISAAQTDPTNTSVVTSAETATTNAGVEFRLKDGAAIINTGAFKMTSSSPNLSDDGSINFTAQPYAVTSVIAAGIIGGSVSYTVAYL